MIIANSIELIGTQPGIPTIEVAPPTGGGAVTRRLMVTSPNRWQIVGRLRQTAQGKDAVVFKHANHQDGLLVVNDLGAWTMRGDAIVSSGHVRVEHPVVFSACMDYAPAIPNGTSTRVNAAQQVRLSVVDAPPDGALSCTIAIGGVGQFGGELPTKPQLPPSGIVAAEVATTGAWTLNKRWQVLDQLLPEALITVDFGAVTPEAQVLGYQGGEFAYRTSSGTTLTLAP